MCDAVISAACQVNPRFAINLVAEEPVVVIDGNHTYCDGGELRVLCGVMYVLPVNKFTWLLIMLCACVVYIVCE